jgi:hypothetical protein
MEFGFREVGAPSAEPKPLVKTAGDNTSDNQVVNEVEFEGAHNAFKCEDNRYPF